MIPRLHEIGVDGRLLGGVGLSMITALVAARCRRSGCRGPSVQLANDRSAGGQGGTAVPTPASERARHRADGRRTMLLVRAAC
jgi:hypothetical protein